MCWQVQKKVHLCKFTLSPNTPCLAITHWSHTYNTNKNKQDMQPVVSISVSQQSVPEKGLTAQEPERERGPRCSHAGETMEMEPGGMVLSCRQCMDRRDGEAGGGISHATLSPKTLRHEYTTVQRVNLEPHNPWDSWPFDVNPGCEELTGILFSSVLQI